MFRHTRTFILVGAIGLLAACASRTATRESAPATPGSAGMGAPHSMMHHGPKGDPGGGMMGAGMGSETCPMKVPGAAVTVGEVEGGAGMTFTTTNPAEVAELRARVKQMAAMHNQGGMMGGGMMGGGMMGGGMMSNAMPEATATAEDVDGGARLAFKAKDAAQLDALRKHVKERADRMQQQRACRVMGGQTAAAPTEKQ